jgi:hypothetical protein
MKPGLITTVNFWIACDLAWGEFIEGNFERSVVLRGTAEAPVKIAHLAS